MAKVKTSAEKLIEMYEKAEQQLIDIIIQKQAVGSPAAYERSLLYQTDQKLRQLKKSSAQIVKNLVQENYKTGLQSLVRDILSDPTAIYLHNMMSGLNTSQIELIAENVSADLNKAVNLVGRRIQDAIREAGIEATAEKLTARQTVREMQKNLEQKLKAQNLTAVPYANGAKMPIKHYAETVARSTTAETQNKAKIVQGQAWGYDLVRITEHTPTCAVCAMYQGRVYALTKEAANWKYKDDKERPLRFPYLYDTALVSGYDTIHPNCRHRLAVFPPRAYTPAELAEFSRKSMQPFEDTRSDKERKTYAQEQAVKRKRNESRKQYEKIKAVLPNDAPKTFAAFVRMKSAQSQKYKELLQDYRAIIRVAKSSENGIINTKDSEKLLFDRNPFYQAVTDEAIKNVPKMNIFRHEEMNLRYQTANADLLKAVQGYEVGTEISAVYDENMRQIGTYRLGAGGKTKIDNPDVPYHAFHNHPSGETFSFEDLWNMTRRKNMLSLTATGNNADIYIILRSNESRLEDYHIFLLEKSKQSLYKGYSYNDIRNGKFNVSSLSSEEIQELKQAIIQFSKECIIGGEQYGFQYRTTKMAD